MALKPADRHGDMIAHHLRADHRQHLGLGRIDLARHDRAARLILRKLQLPKARTRPRTQQADVVGDLGQRHGDGVQDARKLDHRVVRGQLRELVRRAGERQAREVGDFLGEGVAEPLRCIKAGPDRRAALRQPIDPRHYAFDAIDIVGDLLRVAGKFLPQRQRRRILQVRPADLDDAFPALGEIGQPLVHQLERRQQSSVDRKRRRNMQAPSGSCRSTTAPCSHHRSGGPDPCRHVCRTASRWPGPRSLRSRSCSTGCRNPSAR